MKKLSKSPLVYVLAQVRIGAVLKMEDYIPQIQEHLRKEGYPLYREAEVREFLLGSDRPDLTRSKRWHFDGMERNTGFLLQAGSIVFHTTVYDTHEAFFAALERGLSIIQGVVGITAVERLGLRYVDAFQADAGHRLAEYFRTGISGIVLEEIGVAQPRLFFNLTADTRLGGKLVVRLSQNTGGWFLPPDLQPSDLPLNKNLVPDKEIAVLDYDHIIDKVQPFSVDGIIQTFGGLHAVVSEAFQKTVSKFAIEAWT